MNLQFVSGLESKPTANVLEVTNHILNEADEPALFQYLSELHVEQQAEQVS
jgi:hypothetical protein